MSIDVKYQIWKFGVIFTDNVRRGPRVGGTLQGGVGGVTRNIEPRLTPVDLGMTVSQRPPCPLVPYSYLVCYPFYAASTPQEVITLKQQPHFPPCAHSLSCTWAGIW